MKKALSLFTLMLGCTLLFSPAVSAKRILNTAAAKKLASNKVKSAQITEVEQDYDNGKLLYEVELRKCSKEYHLTYRASNRRL